MNPRPPVALVHGFASSAAHNWGATGWLDLLADAGREVIAVDMLGHGRAPRPTDPDAYDRVESDVAAALSGRGPVDAIGFSAGGPFFRQSIRSVWRSLQNPVTRYQPLSSRFQ